MEKFVSVEKMSKKARKDYYAKKRKTWGFKPTTRIKKSDYKKRKAELKAGDY